VQPGGAGRKFIWISEIFRTLKWRYVGTIFGHILWGYSLKFRPYIGLTYGRYLQFRFLKWPLRRGIELRWDDYVD